MCNRVGGIYAVLSTRAASMQAEHPDQVFFFGPDFGDHSDIYFKEDKTLLKDWLVDNQKIQVTNIPVRVGRWMVPGEPIAILLKFDALWSQKDEIYGWLGISSKCRAMRRTATMMSLVCSAVQQEW